MFIILSRYHDISVIVYHFYVKAIGPLRSNFRGQIFVLFENLDPWLLGRALENICNDDVLGGKMFSIQAGFIYFNIRNHKSLIILKYISANSIYEEKIF